MSLRSRSRLHDPHPDVREGAVRLAGRLPGLSGDLLALADDREIRVRFQVAIALGDLDDGRVPGALARIAARDVGDPWVRLAVLSGLRETAWPFLQALLAANPAGSTHRRPTRPGSSRRRPPSSVHATRRRSCGGWRTA